LCPDHSTQTNSGKGYYECHYIITEPQQYFPMLSFSCVVYFAMSAPRLHPADG